MKSILFLCGLCVILPSKAGQDAIFSSGFEPSYTVGGNITGLDALGGSVEIFLNGVSQTTVMNDGSYTSSDMVEAGQIFDVTIDNINCTVMSGSGVMPNNAVTDANIICPLATTVYDIKQGIATGDVALQNMLVTVCKDNLGYNLQTVPSDPDYIGDDYSGVFVFDNTVDCMMIQVGDRVDINPATVDVFFGEIQLQNATYVIQSSGNPLPAPVQTTVAGLDVIGLHPLNAVLVEVQNVAVTSLDSGNSEYNVDTSLTVNDRYYLTTPFPEISESMSFIRGPLRYSFNLNKIAPRTAGDLGREFKLVINEVDYDQPGADEDEFIEIYNLGPGQADLTDLAIVLVNGDGAGNGSLFHSEPLSPAGTLDAGSYLVYGDPDVINALPPGIANIPMPFAVNLQNSGPEGVALVNTVDEDLLDALSYEGEITSGDVGFTNPVNLVEGTATPAADASADGSLSRIPNGQDTDDAVTDWVFSDFSTPGAANITELPPGQLLINEIDYDQPFTDSLEFVELYNSSGNVIDLSTVDLVLINGNNNSEYNRITLTGMIAPGEFAVIGSSTVMVPMGVIKIDFAAATNIIQNGSPDGVAIIENTNNTLIDALSYEGAITAAIITGFANPVSLVEGTATAAADGNTVAGSIIRNPDDQDTGNDSVDFVNSATPTPGETNSL